MKKSDLAKLAMLGISAAMIVGCHAQGDSSSEDQPPSDQQLSSDMQSFFKTLNPEAQKKFSQLDAQHKMMAVEMAQQSCSGKNKCSGMGGCSTEQHACAGQNGCKGQGGAPVKDPNKAVDIQFQNQTNQRQNLNQGFSDTDQEAQKENTKDDTKETPEEKALDNPPEKTQESSPLGAS